MASLSDDEGREQKFLLSRNFIKLLLSWAVKYNIETNYCESIRVVLSKS